MAVDLDTLDRGLVFAPEGGFPADPGNLPGFGITPTAQDANVGSYLSNLINAIQALTTFLQSNPLATLTTAQKTTYTQLQTNFSTLMGQLPANAPSAYAYDFGLLTSVPLFIPRCCALRRLGPTKNSAPK